MGGLSGRGTPLTASSPTGTGTTAAFNVMKHEGYVAEATVSPTEMDFGNLFTSNIVSNNAIGDIMNAVEIPQEDQISVPMEDNTDEEVVVDDVVEEFAGPMTEMEIQFSLQRPLFEMRYMVEANLGKRVSKKSFYLWNERVDEDSRLSDVCYNSCHDVTVGFQFSVRSCALKTTWELTARV